MDGSDFKDSFEITFKDLVEIYGTTVEGIEQQLLVDEFQKFWYTYPRDPVIIARGLSAALGIVIRFLPRDFYKDLPDLPEESRNLYAFHEHFDDGSISIYINSNKLPNGVNLLSRETIRFLILKEIFIAVLRKDFAKKGKWYPDTSDYFSLTESILDLIVERPSISDFGKKSDYPVPSLENAAEILSLLFLLDLEEIVAVKQRLENLAQSAESVTAGETVSVERKLENGGPPPPPRAAIEGQPDFQFSLFDYQMEAEKYQVKVRFVIIMIRSDFLKTFFSVAKEVMSSLQKYLPKISW